MARRVKKFCVNMLRHSEAGMTLLEVLASLGILVVLLTVLSQVLHTGSRLWVKNDYAYQKQHLLQDFYTILAPELRSAYNNQFLATSSLKGSEAELSFWRESEAGLKQITYRYDAVRQTLYRAAGFWGGQPQEQALFTNLTALKFEYFQADARNWKADWEPTEETEFPSLIRITVALAGTNLGSMIIPLKAWSEKDDL